MKPSYDSQLYSPDRLVSYSDVVLVPCKVRLDMWWAPTLSFESSRTLPASVKPIMNSDDGDMACTFKLHRIIGITLPRSSRARPRHPQFQMKRHAIPLLGYQI
jgi:hypothetical protein